MFMQPKTTGCAGGIAYSVIMTKKLLLIYTIQAVWQLLEKIKRRSSQWEVTITV